MEASSFSTLFDAIKNSPPLTIDGVRQFLIMLASSSLSPLEEDQIFGKLINKADFSVKLAALKKEYAAVRQNLNLPPVDVGVVIAQTALKKLYSNGHTILRMPTLGFWTYRGTHWEQVSDEQIRKDLLPIVQSYKSYFPSKSVSAMLAEVTRCLTDLVEFHDVNSSPKNVINTMSGEIWLLDNGSYKFQPHDPASRLFSCLPINFDPKSPCELYDQKIRECFDIYEDCDAIVDHFNEFLGYAIQPERFVESVWFFIGGGENGKSTFKRVLLSFIGSAYHACDMREFGRDFFKFRALFNKLILVDEDFAEDLVLNTGFLKKVSGGGEIGGRSPHKMDGLFFRNTALPLLIGNHQPQCSDVSKGWIRRIYVIPFRKKFSSKHVDPDLFNKISLTEMPGILNRALAGYARLCQRGKKFAPPVTCQDEARFFFERSNWLHSYLRDRVVFGGSGHITLKSLRADIDQWAKAEGLSIPGYGNILKSQLEKLGFEVGLMNGRNSLKKSSLRMESHGEEFLDSDSSS